MAGEELTWRSFVEIHLRPLTRPGSVEQGRLVVAELQGSVVGFVHYQVERATRTGTIGVSAVHPAVQGRGIGTLLYRHALFAMRAQGVRYATAESSGHPSHAAARRAYEKVGFVGLPMVHFVMPLGGSRTGAAGAGPAGSSRRRPARPRDARARPGKARRRPGTAAPPRRKK